MADAPNLHNVRVTIVRTNDGPELRVDGQRRVGARTEPILRLPLSRHAAHKLAVALLQACVPEGDDG